MLNGLKANDTGALSKLSFLNKAVNESPDNPAVWTARGDLHFSKDLGEKGRPVRGMADYEMAISINPSYVDAWRGKGYALFAQRKYEAAVEALTTAIKNGGNSGGLYLHRGLCYKRLGETDKAKDDFTYIIASHNIDDNTKSFAALLLVCL